MQVKNIFSAILITAMFASFISCKGKTGPAGPAGAGGENSATAVFQNNVSPSDGYTGCADSTLDSGIPNYNTGACGQLFIGGNDTPEIYRAVIKFDLAFIVPTNVSVTAAALTLYFADPADEAGSNTYTVYGLTKAWTEGTGACGASGAPDVNVSWDYCDGSTNLWASPGGDYAAGAASGPVFISAVTAGESITFSIDPALVQSWIENPAANFGIIIKGSQETGAAQFWISPCSGNNTQVNLRPRLAVTYSVP